MDKQNITWKELIRYVNGEVTDHEIRIIEEWMEEAPENRERALFVKRVYNTPAELKEEWDADAAWKRFSKQHSDVTGRGSKSGSGKMKGWQIHQIGRKDSYRWVAAAAAVIIIGLAGLFFHSQESEQITEKIRETVYREIVANPGSRTQLKLTDGSTVVLKPGSQLVVPESFRHLDERRVVLTGEAYFEVTPDQEKTFLVETDHTITRVLGTKFNVSSYPDDDEVSVAVVSGLVSLQGRENKVKQPVRIAENQLGVYSSQGEVEVSEIFDMVLHLGWLDGELVFHQEPLERVAMELERWYDIEIKVDSGYEELSNKKLTSSFRQHQPIEEVLEAVSLTLEISFTEENGTFFFTN